MLVQKVEKSSGKRRQRPPVVSYRRQTHPLGSGSRAAHSQLRSAATVAAATARASSSWRRPPLPLRDRPELPCPLPLSLLPLLPPPPPPPPAGLRCRPLSPLPPFGGVGERLRLSRRLPGEGRRCGGPWHKASKAAAVEWTKSSTTSVVHPGMAPECTSRCSFCTPAQGEHGFPSAPASR